MKHLTPDEMVDAAEGVLDVERQRHLGTCEACREEAEALRTLLRETADVGVPEPSPLFWDHFSERVRRVVAEEHSPARGWARWLGWSTLAPGALAAVLLAAVATVVSVPPLATKPPMPAAAPVASADEAADVLLEADRWDVVAALVGGLDWEAAGEAGLTLTPGDADLAVLSLTEDEQRELSRLLAGEIARSKS